MTTIQLTYNPYTKMTHIFNDNKEITATENKIFTFLHTNSFYDCLLPFNKRYVIWEGLLPELLLETNDEELQVVFEGREVDFQHVADAFEQLKPAVESAGYENRWQLSHIRNFEADDIAQQLVEIARDLREMCESRAELCQVDSLIAKTGSDRLCESCREMRGIIESHIAQWRQSDSDYKAEKIVCLEMLESRLDEAEEQAESMREGGL